MIFSVVERRHFLPFCSSFVFRLGALTLDLNRLYKPAKDAENCSTKLFDEKSSEFVSLFEMKRLKGWWPCVDLLDGETILTVRSLERFVDGREFFSFFQGKIELELEILNSDEARERPAGRGREMPNENPKLDEPK